MTESEGNITCSICYNEFYDYTDEEKDYYEYELDINNCHECETENCKCIICHKCELKLLSDPKYDKEAFKCPMCRQYQWNHYFTTMVLGISFYKWRKQNKQKLIWEIEYLTEEKERIDKELRESLEKLAIFINF